MAHDTKQASPFAEIGSTGLKRSGGRIHEEFLTELTGTRGVKAYKEMSENDPTVGALLFAIGTLIKQVSWEVDPAIADDAAAIEIAEFVKGAIFEDMATSWDDTLNEILTMLVFGWSWLEIVFKRRIGPLEKDPTRRSKFSDGKIGFRKWAIRSQESLQEWKIDENGGIQALVQNPPPDFGVRTIPIQRSLLFRTSTSKNNPEGKALDPMTPVPTPDGWRTLDDLIPGSKVFDEQGSIRYVQARADWDNRPCYAMRFNGGEEIIADANHQWPTALLWERSRRLPAKIRTTEEIFGTTKNSNGVSNHGIIWAGALDYPAQALPVAPYYLGLWLGDGDTNTARISCHVQDELETIGQITACGYTAVSSVNGGSENGRAISVYGKEKYCADAPQRLLRVMGVLGDKHVPVSYMQGSTAQRSDLLSGLMDSDGHCDAYGRCEFSNTNQKLANGVAELVRSLGTSAYVTTKKNSSGNMTWLVKFTPDVAPFRLQRKVARCKHGRARKFHYITDVSPVSPRRTVCIEVDSPSHLFIVGRNMVPTHNSMLRNAYRPHYFKRRIEEVEGIGIERDLAGLPVLTPKEGVDLWNTNDAAAAAAKTDAENLIRSIRRDEQEGVLKPFGWTLELLTTGGKRQFDTTKIIGRYDQRILMTAMADFLLLGHEKVGSFALSDSKTSLFTVAIGSLLDSVTSVINDHAVTRLMAINGMNMDLKPTVVHGDIETPDLAALGSYVGEISDAGVDLTDDEAQRYLRRSANIPQISEEQREFNRLEKEGMIEGLMDQVTALQNKVEAMQPATPVLTNGDGEEA